MNSAGAQCSVLPLVYTALQLSSLLYAMSLKTACCFKDFDGLPVQPRLSSTALRNRFVLVLELRWASHEGGLFCPPVGVPASVPILLSPAAVP